MTTYTAPYAEICLEGNPFTGNFIPPTLGGVVVDQPWPTLTGLGQWCSVQNPYCPAPSLPSASIGNYTGVDAEALLISGNVPNTTAGPVTIYSILGLQVPSVWP